MANEATMLKRKSLPVNRTVADGTTIEKGALLVLSDPNTVATHSADAQAFAGVAAAEKISGSGVTTIGVYEIGDVKMTLSGSCTVGDDLALDASVNHVRLVDPVTVSGSRIVGQAMETGTTGETIRVRMNIR